MLASWTLPKTNQSLLEHCKSFPESDLCLLRVIVLASPCLKHLTLTFIDLQNLPEHPVRNQATLLLTQAKGNN